MCVRACMCACEEREQVCNLVDVMGEYKVRECHLFLLRDVGCYSTTDLCLNVAINAKMCKGKSIWHTCAHMCMQTTFLVPNRWDHNGPDHHMSVHSFICACGFSLDV